MPDNLTRLQTNTLQDLRVLMLTKLGGGNRGDPMTTNLFLEVKKLLGCSPELPFG